MANRFYYSLGLYALVASSPRLRAALDPVVLVAISNIFIWFAVYQVAGPARKNHRQS